MITAGADENLFRLVPVLGHEARVLLLERVPKFVLGHQQRLCSDWRLCPGTNFEWGLSYLSIIDINLLCNEARKRQPSEIPPAHRIQVGFDTLHINRLLYSYYY